MGTGEREGDEVVMAYHSAGEAIRSKVDHPVPIKSLIAFQRTRLPSGGHTMLNFDLMENAVKMVNKDGDKVLYEGERTIIFKNGAGQVSEIQVDYRKEEALDGRALVV